MKKFLALLLAVVMCIGVFAGCSSKSKTYETLDDLKGATVVSKTGTTGSQYAEELAKEYDLNVLYVEESATMYNYLESNQAAAVFEDYPIVQYEISRGNIKCKVINVSDYSFPTGFATMKGAHPELVAAFNEGLFRLKESGKYDEILAKYFGESDESSKTGEASSGEDPALYEQVKGKTYVVGTDTTFAPFEFEDDNGEHTGIDIELVEAIADEMGFNVEWSILGFSAAVTALEANQVDAVMAGMSITDERCEKYDFSVSYYDCAIAVAVAAD